VSTAEYPRSRSTAAGLKPFSSTTRWAFPHPVRREILHLRVLQAANRGVLQAANRGVLQAANRGVLQASSRGVLHASSRGVLQAAYRSTRQAPPRSHSAPPIPRHSNDARRTWVNVNASIFRSSAAGGPVPHGAYSGPHGASHGPGCLQEYSAFGGVLQGTHSPQRAARGAQRGRRTGHPAAARLDDLLPKRLRHARPARTPSRVGAPAQAAIATIPLGPFPLSALLLSPSPRSHLARRHDSTQHVATIPLSTSPRSHL
jgi:hypothetical protein